jgi:WD40 repeat protein/serine/threonine protein kinase
MNDSLSQQNQVEALAEEFLERRRQGERPTIAEYAARYPELADEIRACFPALLLVEDLKPDPAEASGPQGAPVGPSRRPPVERLGDYRVLREVGRGGMGVVYEAEQESLGRHVALKVLPRQALLDPKQVQRFQREAKAAARLHHTNIVPVFGVGEENGLHYYVMQFIPGLGLDAVLEELKRLRQLRNGKRHPPQAPASGGEGHNPSAAAVAEALLTGNFAHNPQPARPADEAGCPHPSSLTVAPSSADSSATIHLPGQAEGSTLSESGRQYWQSVARIGVQVAEALAHAHGQGILHRDIKPSNLLLDTRGTVWVTDFGLAKAVAGDENLTHTGDIVGTLRYMAPERFQGKSDPRSDLYGLGVTLYELLTLRPAFAEADRNKLLGRVLHEEPRRPRKVNPEVPRDLETVVLKAIAKEPRQRYATAANVAEDLRRFLSDRPIQARPVGPWERGWRWCRRNPVVAGLAAALLLAMTVGLVASTLFAVHARHEATRADEKAQEAARVALTSRRQAYDANMLLMQVAWEQDQVVRFLELLQEQEPGPGQEDLRGFEWYFWSNKLQRGHCTLKGHTGWVQGVAFSPDGRRLASGSRDGTVKVWDAQTGQEIRTLKDHTGTVYRVAYSPDGRRLASASADGTVKVWDAQTGQRALSLEGHTDHVHGVAFGPDGRQVASASADQTVKVWDAQTGQDLRTLEGHTGNVSNVVFSPDGRRLASASWDGTVRVWDAQTGQNVVTFTGHTDGVKVEGLTFSPDSRHLASASVDGMVKVWEAQTGQEVLSFRGHAGPVYGVVYSPDGCRLASASVDGMVKVWNAQTGREIFTLKGHTGSIYSVAYSPDGRRLASASWDGTVKVWDGLTGQEARTLEGHANAIRGVAFSPDGRRLASASEDNTLKVWDTQTGQEALTLKGHSGKILGLAYSPDSRHLASASADNTLKVWDTQTGQEALTLKGHTYAVEGVAYSPDGRRLASASSDGTVRVWDAQTGQNVLTLKGHCDGVEGVAFSPDGRRLASASRDQTVKIYDAATGQEQHTFQGHTGGVFSVAFSPDGSRLASASEEGVARWRANGTVNVWDAQTGHKTLSLQGHTQRVNSVAFSPDGRRLASASGDQTVKLWDLATGREVLALKGHTSEVFGVAFSPDGARLASASGDGTVKVWDGRPWTPEAVEQAAPGHPSWGTVSPGPPAPK